MVVPHSRILELMKVQCRIFSSTFNPQNLRTGNKILRQRLRGPALAAYYPKKGPTIRDLEDVYVGMETFDEEEEERIDKLALLKSKGKGAPKKRRTFEESKKYKGKE